MLQKFPNPLEVLKEVLCEEILSQIVQILKKTEKIMRKKEKIQEFKILLIVPNPPPQNKQTKTKEKEKKEERKKKSKWENNVSDWWRW